MLYTTKAISIPDGAPVNGVRATLTRLDDGIVAATGTTDVNGEVTLQANGAPGNVAIELNRGGDRWRDDSRAMRPYGQFSSAEWQDTARELFGDGVVPYGNHFVATAGSGSITVATGAALLNGVLGVWYTETILPVSDGARACAVEYSGSGRLRLIDVAQADLTANLLPLYTYNVSGGTVTALTRVAVPILLGTMTKHPTVQAVARAASGDTSSASGEASGLELTLDLVSGVTYDIKATATVISRARAGAIAIEIDGNLSSYAANGGDVTTTISNAHTRSKTGGSCLIRLFERSDTALTEWVSDLSFGSFGSGDANFNNPGQIARDSSGNIYIADTANDRVKKHQADGTFVSNFITSVDEVTGVCVDDGGNVYIAFKSGTSDYRIRKYNSAGSLQWTSAQNLFAAPHLATDGTRVYEANAGSNFINIYLCSDGSRGTGFGGSGSADGQFNTPVGIATDDTYLYVVDQGNDRVQKFTLTGSFVAKWGSSGSGDGQFTTPVGIAVNPVNGNILVTDSGRDDIQEFTNTGTFVRKYATLGSGSGQVNDPTGIVVAASGTSFYVADQGNDRIQRFTETASAFTYDAALLFAKAIPR